MQGDRVNVEKELKYNHYIFISSTDSHASHPKEQCCSEETGIQSLGYFGPNIDGAIAKCLLCKYNPTKGDAHKSSLEWWKHHESQFPLLAKLVKRVFPVPATSSNFERVFSVAGNVVTPIRANLNPEKVEDLVVVKCNSRLLKSIGFIRK